MSVIRRQEILFPIVVAVPDEGYPDSFEVPGRARRYAAVDPLSIDIHQERFQLIAPYDPRGEKIAPQINSQISIPIFPVAQPIKMNLPLGLSSEVLHEAVLTQLQQDEFINRLLEQEALYYAITPPEAVGDLNYVRIVVFRQNMGGDRLPLPPSALRRDYIKA